MSQRPRSPLTYRDAGVDIDAGNRLVDAIKPLVNATRRDEVLGGLGGFGGLFHLGQRFNDPVLVSGTDGVGTKLLLARQLERHDTIGIDLVAMCVNDILVSGAEPLFFLDYFSCGHLDLAIARTVIEGIAEGCRQAQCALIGGETAEMPGLYGRGEYDLAGFAVGAVERSQLIDGKKIQPGDRVIGLPSSGPHSNGYSLIRRILEQKRADLDQPLDGQTLGQALLAPTVIYKQTIDRLTEVGDILGMAHITGGGLVENAVRCLPPGTAIECDLTAWSPPPVFQWLAEHGPVSTSEMRRTFNLGIGFIVVCRGGDVQAMLAASDLAACEIGRIVTADHGERIRFAS